jgi:putative peptidoglycan lipid II flippase
MTTAEEPIRPDDGRSRRSLGLSTLLFSLATGVSRVLGLVREIIVAKILGIGPIANALEVANTIPNVIRSFVADAALGAALVPVFTELLERGERKRAWRVASTVLTLATIFLSLLTLAFELFARSIVSVFTVQEQVGDATTYARILFPIVILLGASGIVNSVLNAFDEFFTPAVAPVFWNLVIFGFLVVALLDSDQETQALLYALGIVVGTLVQFTTPLPSLRHRGGRLGVAFAIGDPAVQRVFILMAPITLGLGLINVNVLIDSLFAKHTSDPASGVAAIGRAFRVYMLPQGMFSVAVASVLFPSLARAVGKGDMTEFRTRFAAGTRQILALLIPSSVFCGALAVPIVRLLYAHGAFREQDVPLVAGCLAAFSLGLAANGVVLLLTRSFFSLQAPWLPTAVAVGNLVLNAGLDAVLYRLGLWGIPLATAIANTVQVVVLWVLLRREVGSLDTVRVLDGLLRTLLASIVVGWVTYGAWYEADRLLGRTTAAQLVSMLVAVVVGGVLYLRAAKAIGLTEASAALAAIGERLRR